jgi:cytochrome c oxidase subunit IV
VLELVRRKKLTEEYSFVWLVCALALLVVALGRRLFLDRVALAMGIYYPPAALLLVLIFFVFVASLSFPLSSRASASRSND